MSELVERLREHSDQRLVTLSAAWEAEAAALLRRAAGRIEELEGEVYGPERTGAERYHAQRMRDDDTYRAAFGVALRELREAGWGPTR